MGEQGNIRIRGTIENIIYYSLNGKFYMRTKPASVNRTAASVKSGLNFGKACRVGRQLRLLVAPINPCNGDKKLMFRLTGALNRFIHCLSGATKTRRSTGLGFLRDFQFNDQAIVQSILSFSIRPNSKDSGSPGLTISPFIPGSSLLAPKKTTQILCRTVITCTNLEQVSTKLLGKSEFIIPYQMELYEPPAFLFTAFTQPDDLILLIMSLEFQSLRNGEMQTDARLRYRPCGIVWTR